MPKKPAIRKSLFCQFRPIQNRNRPHKQKAAMNEMKAMMGITLFTLPTALNAVWCRLWTECSFSVLPHSRCNQMGYPAISIVKPAQDVACHEAAVPHHDRTVFVNRCGLHCVTRGQQCRR